MLPDEPRSGPEPTAPAADAMLPVSAEQFNAEKRKRKLTIAAAAVVALAVAGYAYTLYTDPLRAAESYDNAERLFRIARYSQAIVSLDRAVNYKSNFPEAYLLRGRAHFATGELDAALADFTKVIELRPEMSAAYLERATIYQDLKKFPQALADCEKVIALTPKSSQALNLKGIALRATGDLQSSAQALTSALAIEENLANYLQRGSTYQQMNAHKQAVADFDKALEFDPMNPQVFFARSASRRAIGDKKGADADHREARLLDGR